MKNVYTAYTKVIEDTTFYFVKKFTTFPELAGVPDILESFGMHKNFEEACKIACISDQKIKAQLVQEIESNQVTSKVIQMNSPLTLIKIGGIKPQFAFKHIF